MSPDSHLSDQLAEIACRIVESDADGAVLERIRETIEDRWTEFLLSTYDRCRETIQETQRILCSTYASAKHLLELCREIAEIGDQQTFRQAIALLEQKQHRT